MSAFAHSAISNGEIDAWSRLTGNRLSPWEHGMLRRLDVAWMKSQAKMQKDKR